MVSAWIIRISWAAFLLTWVLTARGIKKDAVRSSGWVRWAGIRMLAVVAVILSLRYPLFHRLLLSDISAIVVAGDVLTVAGVAVAVWARLALGSNWSPVPSIKHGHELATAGPYRLVRHPIYAGMLFGLIGSALADRAAVVWPTVLVAIAIVIAYRIRIEERLMRQQFPNEYPDYEKRTRAIIPFIL